MRHTLQLRTQYTFRTSTVPNPTIWLNFCASCLVSRDAVRKRNLNCATNLRTNPSWQHHSAVRYSTARCTTQRPATDNHTHTHTHTITAKFRYTINRQESRLQERNEAVDCNHGAGGCAHLCARTGRYGMSTFRSCPHVCVVLCLCCTIMSVVCTLQKENITQAYPPAMSFFSTPFLPFFFCSNKYVHLFHVE